MAPLLFSVRMIQPRWLTETPAVAECRLDPNAPMDSLLDQLDAFCLRLPVRIRRLLFDVIEHIPAHPDEEPAIEVRWALYELDKERLLVYEERSPIIAMLDGSGVWHSSTGPGPAPLKAIGGPDFVSTQQADIIRVRSSGAITEHVRRKLGKVVWKSPSGDARGTRGSASTAGPRGRSARTRR